jgi:hypothetical protein
MQNIFTQLMNATTQREVDVVVDKNIWNLSPSGRSHLTIFANKRKRTIQLVKKEAKKSFANLLN